MQIVTSAVRDSSTAEGVTSVNDLTCLYKPRQLCYRARVEVEAQPCSVVRRSVPRFRVGANWRF